MTDTQKFIMQAYYFCVSLVYVWKFQYKSFFLKKKTLLDIYDISPIYVHENWGSEINYIPKVKESVGRLWWMPSYPAQKPFKWITHCPSVAGTVQGETPVVQPLQCLSQLHKTLSPKVVAFLMKLTSHGEAKQDYKGSVTST